MKRPTRIGAIVAGDSTLAGLLRRARELESLETLVRAWLPPALAPHVRVAALREDTLVLAVDSPAWATRLRYECPRIVDSARGHAATRGVNNVKIRVVVDEPGT
jgi:hypothetical protein